jgi:ADP-ribose pyrophosphatase YjhB (NUDIX family)
MNKVKDAFCSFCGTAFAIPLKYPRKCPNAACGVQIWANPIPVSVVLVPVLHNGQVGLLVVRRDIEPRKGLLAVVGGFLEEHETWQQGGAREIVEETGIKIDHEPLRAFWFTSTQPRPNRVLLFSTAPEVDAASFTTFTPNRETSERGLVFGPDGLNEVFAFPLHAEAAQRFFTERNITGPHRYTQL